MILCQWLEREATLESGRWLRVKEARKLDDYPENKGGKIRIQPMASKLPFRFFSTANLREGIRGWEGGQLLGKKAVVDLV